MHSYTKYLIIGMCLFASAFHAHSQPSSDVPSLVGASGFFRGSTWQDTKGTVKKKESGNLTFENDTILQYELPLDKQRSLELTYVFDPAGLLKRIETSSIFENGLQEINFQKAVMNFYTDKLGSPTRNKNGTCFWEHKTKYKVELLSIHDLDDLGTEIIYTPN